MTSWLFTLRKRFTLSESSRWDGYRRFSGFCDIAELVTLDGMMCPDIVRPLRDADWQHNVHEDFRTTLFYNAEYLINRQPIDSSSNQLLAVYECPDGSEVIPEGFTVCGYDIMDSEFGNSTLTNCGPIPATFAPQDVNRYGLVSDLSDALIIRDAMHKLQPDDPHLGDCKVWLVARRILRSL